MNSFYIELLDRATTASLLVSWLAGIVLAHGFWLTALSIFFPFYAWYLVVERLLSACALI